MTGVQTCALPIWTVTVTRRDLGKVSKQTISIDDFVASAGQMLRTIQDDMYQAAASRNEKMIQSVADLAELETKLSRGEIGFFRIKYDQTLNDAFDALQETYKISRRCLDDADPAYVFVAKSY